MDDIKKYVIDNLHKEMGIISSTGRNNEYPQLSVYEKAVIYKYSDRGFADLNSELRKSKGMTFSELATYLDESISKLDDYYGLVFRKVYLTDDEIQRYADALTNDEDLTEYTFISTTKSALFASLFTGTNKFPANCLFRMAIIHGKEIDKIAKFDEKEVLIRPNSIHQILGIKKENGLTTITMEEI